ncbi:MAG: hypothetical protein MJE77_32640, partial [Proteobacteria bacterium]|nr:hypothetical protein [Pseudomonadota bacterium]
MSWDLNVDIDLDQFGDATRLLSAMIKSSRPFLGELKCHERGPGLDVRNPVLAEHQLSPMEDHTLFFAKRVEQIINADQCLELELWIELERSERLLTPVYVYIFGSAHAGLSDYRRRYPVNIDFCNRQRWKGNDNLITGEPADEQFVLRWLTEICELSRPRSLYVIPEESVNIPFNYHMVYHNHAAGHADDLRELARLALKGGRGYDDARWDYQPLLDIPGENILFCRRAGGRLDDLKNELRDRRAILENLLDGLEVPDQ